MNTHELAEYLLELPDLPIATHAMGHTYLSKADAYSHGELTIALMDTHSDHYIVLGHMLYKNRVGSNETILEVYKGKVFGMQTIHPKDSNFR